MRADLEMLETGLMEARCGAFARSLVRPVRRQVEAFGFRALALDIRQNAMVVNGALQAIWRQLHLGAEPPGLDSEA